MNIFDGKTWMCRCRVFSSHSSFAPPPGFNLDEGDDGKTIKESFAQYLNVRDKKTVLSQEEVDLARRILLSRVDK